ncbi:Hypothetical predicted protein [Xyrichtys novacula]|uniref:Uncharacterized protein n=1 Tax=Xyrichtys novacula TaxID=13765 RepID=A0AAV1FZQ4_XYRNO|nr:Hypothetical predicted protein [Xyrichtys novacula]
MKPEGFGPSQAILSRWCRVWSWAAVAEGVDMGPRGSQEPTAQILPLNSELPKLRAAAAVLAVLTSWTSSVPPWSL